MTYAGKAVHLSENMWNALQTVRNLGGVIFSTLNDVTFAAVVRKLAGMKAVPLLAGYLKVFTPDDAARALAGVDKAARQLSVEARMAGEWNGKSVSRYLQDRVLQLGLVEAWTKGGCEIVSDYLRLKP